MAMKLFEQGACSVRGNTLPAGRRRSLASLALLAVLAACGGGGGGGSGGSTAQAGSPSVGSVAPADSAASSASGGESGESVGKDLPASREAAARFLTQATFGPTDADTDQLMSLGYSGWIDAQFALPQSLHLADWDAVNAKIKAANASQSATHVDVVNSFWKRAVKGDDQLRQRMAFALSEIMVVSTIDSTVPGYPRGVASYLDMLGDKGLGNYRDLLESVALHPMMAIYLSSLHNQKADAVTGRVPDENFAREVMQLMSIGLHQLNLDGSEKLDGSGQPIATYGPADVAGLAKVFTGWSWDCASLDSACFFTGHLKGGTVDSNSPVKPMVIYTQYHSTEAKSFLGVTIPARSDAKADLKVALDTLFNHPNVGPFIGRQLIQRLVTSNPSPAYVTAVAKVFNDNGSGVRGDLRAVLKAILTNPEARVVSTTSGKLREPVLRLSAYLRAFAASSDSGEFRVSTTDDAGSQLGQTPMRSPSVFNFYRPGYAAPGTLSSGAGLVAPEFQIAHETSAAGYVNFMRDAVRAGVGLTGAGLNRRDVQIDTSAEFALADQPAKLVDRLNAKLMYGGMPDALKTEIVGAVNQIPIAALRTDGSNQASITNAKTYRVFIATLLTLASPEFQIQK